MQSTVWLAVILLAWASAQQEVPFLEVAVLQSTLATQRIRRLGHFRTITVKGFPASDALPSEGLRAAWPRLLVSITRSSANASSSKSTSSACSRPRSCTRTMSIPRCRSA